MRGEHHSSTSGDGSGRGSSPRARGAPGSRSSSCSRSGIIPACAGSTSFLPLAICCSRDHPRVRGEHSDLVERLWRPAGSSPRARGAHGEDRGHLVVAGIIPACAGSTFSSMASRSRPGDHPRVRGEHSTRMMFCAAIAGSSPRARGALSVAGEHRPHRGIIPACAGSTAIPGWSPSGEGDHPRVRGEHCDSRLVTFRGGGSSPRARGARRKYQKRPGLPGIIPACAGSTMGGINCRRYRWDHPRVRGEHLGLDNFGNEQSGSSPRARGALARDCERD